MLTTTPSSLLLLLREIPAEPSLVDLGMLALSSPASLVLSTRARTVKVASCCLDRWNRQLLSLGALFASLFPLDPIEIRPPISSPFRSAPRGARWFRRGLAAYMLGGRRTGEPV